MRALLGCTFNSVWSGCVTSLNQVEGFQKIRSGIYRELIVGNYRVVYQIDEDIVTIMTIIHGARILRL